MRRILGATLGQILASRGRPSITRQFNVMPKAFVAPPPAPSPPPVMKKKKKKKVTSSVIVKPAESEKKEDKEAKPEEQKPGEAKTEEKKEEKKPRKKMKKWPDDEATLVDYRELVGPLKTIITQGYRLFRKDQKEFDYEGYNIGEHELNHFPPPKYRFTEQLLAFDDKRNVKLIDVVLNVLFLLGIEQGRRAERRDHKPMELVLKTMDKFREENKNLRLKIDELEVKIEVLQKNPELIGEALKQAIIDGVKQRRNARLFEAKKELGIDPVRSNFEFKTPKRVKFRELERLAKSLDKKTCSQEQWKELLKERGWTFDEWISRCKKKFVHTDFS